MGEFGAKDVAACFCSPDVEDDDDRRSEFSSFYGDSDDSILSSTTTSSDLADDATYSSPSSSSLSSNGSQFDPNQSSFDLSSLVAELPIKRGLSRYFDGKSESFISLSDARCIEDLVKKVTPSRKRLKASGDWGLNSTQKRCSKSRFYGRTISKKTSKSSSLTRRNRNGALPSSKMPRLPLHENLQ